ncbi:MAG TPA: DUF4126 domain-containing protein [Acidobacteriota bacterium]|nr:DUF4126 domain-containing protein [Acidobacteriota bacterium]
MDVSPLALALGSSVTAGLNLYLTVFTLGLLHRIEVFALPDKLQILANPWVLGVAGILLLVEIIADKIPVIDNAWDFIQGFVRVPAGGLLAAGAFNDASSFEFWMLVLLGGLTSFSAHGAKSSTRLAANMSPEPFSNWFLSLFEDGLSLGLLWLITSYPEVAIVIALVVFLACVAIILMLYKFFRMLFRTRAKPSTPGEIAKQ